MTAKTDIENTEESNAVSVESTALLGLVADIRTAVGDPTGKLMQDELVEHCREMRGELLRLKVEHRRLIESVTTWRDMPAAEMRLRAGEMTAQEIRSVKAVLRCIWPNDSFTNKTVQYYPQSGEIPPTPNPAPHTPAA